MPKIVFCPADIDACALYRMYIPHLETPGSKFVFAEGKLMFEEIAEAKVVVVQRQCTQGNFAALAGMKKMGQKIVYDLDDNLWSLPAYNYAKSVFNEYRKGFGICMEMCDVLTVSTNRLKSAIKTANPGLRKEIVVVPNAVNFNLMPKAPLKRLSDTVVIGWQGTNSHVGDVVHAWEALPKVEAACDNVRFEFVGLAGPKGLKYSRERPFVPVSEFYSRLASWNWDIMLAPLENNRFNKSKSNIKMLEAAVAGAPCLVSPVQGYMDFIAHDKELSYLVCTTTSEWTRKIVELANEKERRDYYAGRMEKVVQLNYGSDVIAKQWHDVFREVM